MGRRALFTVFAAVRRDCPRLPDRGPEPRSGPSPLGCAYTTVKSVSLALMSGGSTETPQARASAIVRTTFSILSLSVVSAAAKNSVG